ncbi:hypothetical protein J2128_001978 [Methanomicrobium sp. W14]|uniref:hypothetical protein n=1 Tax=Methanomicrobium sp. W14 TaxID=2817839 RepID=UPI001AEB4A9D|nr:hypothetical protein [Methanomicrobium sp. W14]MBP2134012.1 hypothetical protein [Methanomicrobium sp. W14]
MNSEYKEKISGIFSCEGIGSVITCTQALSISGKYGIPEEDIGKFCNTNGIKIRGCKLGCFK